MPEDFAGLFGRLRKAARLVQAQIAEACGVAPQTVSAWETGRAAPTGDVCEKLAELLRTDPVPLLRAAAMKRRGMQMPLEESLHETEGEGQERLGALASTIRKKRVKLRLSLEELAKACNAEVAEAKCWERGDARPSLKQAVALAKNLQIRTRELLQLWAGRGEEPGAITESGEEETPLAPASRWAPPRPLKVYNIGGEFDYDWEEGEFPAPYRDVQLPATDEGAFACILRDDKMEPDLHRGDVLLFARSVEARSGDLALIRERNRALARLVYFEADEESESALVSLHGRSPRVTWHKKEDLVEVHKMLALFRVY